MKTIIFFFCTLFFFNTISAQTKMIDGKANIPLDPKVKFGVLENGFTYYIRQNKHPEQKIELRLIVNAGSVLENDQQQGLAHFMEHMNFNGTQHFKKNDLIDYLQSIGVRFGADLNAYTSFDETVYMLSVPTTKSINIEKAFQVMEDWSHLTLLKTKDIDEERGVILEESRLNKGAQLRFFDSVFGVLYEGTAYANRLPIGKDAIIKTFNPNVLRQFHKDWYRPDLMAIAVVGNIDPELAYQYIKKHFASWKPMLSPKKRPVTSITPFKANKGVIILDDEQTKYQVHIFFNPVKKVKEKTWNDFKQSIIRSMINDIFSLKVSEMLQQSQPPFSRASIYTGSFVDRTSERLMVSIDVGKLGLKAAIDAVIQEVMKVAQHGFSQLDLEVAKKEYLGRLENMYNERDKTNSNEFAAEYVQHYLKDEPSPGIENEFLFSKSVLPHITLLDLQNELKKYLHHASFYAFIAAPKKDKATMPSEQELVQYISSALKATVSNIFLEDKQLPLLDKLPAQGKVLSQYQDTLLKTTHFVLSNGLKVVLKETSFKNDEILVNMVLKGGANNFPAKQKYTLNYMISFLEAMGWGKFKPNALAKINAGKKIWVSPYLTSILHGMKGSSTTKDIEAFFQLLHLKLTSPRIDQDLFTGLANQFRDQAKLLSLNPENSFYDAFYKSQYNDHPYMPIIISKPEYMDSVSLHDIQAIYPSYWQHFDQATMFIVGNINSRQLIPLLERYLAPLPNANVMKLSWEDNHMRPLANNGLFKFTKGKDEKSLITMVLRKVTPYNDTTALHLDLLNDLIAQRLLKQIREKKAWVYNVHSTSSAKKYPYSRMMMYLELPCGPNNVDNIIKAVWQEMEDIKKNGVREEDLNKVKMQALELIRKQERLNAYWLLQLEAYYILDTDPRAILHLSDLINSTTPEDIKKIANDFLKKEYSYTGILYPERQ